MRPRSCPWSNRCADLRVAKNTVVSLDVELSDIWGNLIQRSEEPVQYLHGGYGDIFPAVEAALEGKDVKDRVEVRLEPEDAFGDYDPEMMRMEPVANLPPDIAIGGYLVAEQDGQEVVWRVTEIADGKAMLDGNHELAGQRLRFDCTVVDIRPASAEEIAHGHAHGPDGHHHH
jgi:FKBP-type peptidyl-prolyl cis-trans isomerase SlyD